MREKKGFPGFTGAENRDRIGSRTDGIVRRKETAMYLLGAAAALFGLDQCLKQLVEGQSPERFPRSMDHTGGRIKLYRNHNRGFCFEVLKHRPSLVRQLPLCLTSMAGGILCFLSAQEGNTGRKRRDMPGAWQEDSAISTTG